MVTLGARAGTWLAIGLFISLAGNVFAGGLLAGRYFGPHAREFSRPGEHGAPPAPAAGALAAPIIQRMIASLPPENRLAFETALAERRQAAIEAGNAAREARRKLRDVLNAEKYDRAAADAAFAEMRAKSMETQRIMHETIAAAAERLPLEARRRLAEQPRDRPPQERTNP